MSVFVTGAVILLLLAAATLLWPVWRYRDSQQLAGAGNQEREAENVALYLEHQKELEADLASGRIDTQQFEKLQQELKRNLLSDQKATAARDARRGGSMILLISIIAVAAASVWLYLARGSSGDVLFTQLQSQVSEHNMAALREGRQPAIEPTLELIKTLEERVKTRPENPQYWYLLGRYGNQVGDYATAVRGFRGAYDISPNDPGLASQLAQSLFFVNDNRMNDEISFLVQRSLELDPEDTTALGLAGIEAFGAQNFQAAADYWQRAVDLTPPNAPGRDALQAGIERARQELGQGAASGTSSWRIAVNVSLADGLELPAQGMLFVVAKEFGGSPMPLVASRLPLDSLNESIILDETMAMTSSARLATDKPLELIARISVAGTAMAQAGDLEGRIGPVTMAEIDGELEVVIDKKL